MGANRATRRRAARHRGSASTDLRPDARRPPEGGRQKLVGVGRRPRRQITCRAWRWWRVRRNIFLCFFLRMRLRRFLISEPIARQTLPADAPPPNSKPAVRCRPLAWHVDRPGSFNGRTAVFGAAYRGSNPLPGAALGGRDGRARRPLTPASAAPAPRGCWRRSWLRPIPAVPVRRRAAPPPKARSASGHERSETSPRRRRSAQAGVNLGMLSDSPAGSQTTSTTWPISTVSGSTPTMLVITTGPSSRRT